MHFVTHSMGGIVLRRFLARNTLPHLGKTVVLASPNNGSLLARSLLGNPLIQAILGAAAATLTDGASLNATCAVLNTPVLVIAGTKARDIRNPISLFSSSVLQGAHDGTVTVAETRLPRMDQFIEVDACHTWIMNHPDTLRAISAFLWTENSRRAAG
jgi:triacylglycerol lipase